MKRVKERLYVDGYNVLNQWNSLQDALAHSLESARELLIDKMNEYQSFTGIPIYLIFDAYKLKDGWEKEEKRKNIHVVFTKELETADAYIERKTHELIQEGYRIYVATGDFMEQQTVMAKGALRISARELEVRYEQMHQMYRLRKKRHKQPFEDGVLNEKTAKEIEKILRLSFDKEGEL